MANLTLEKEQESAKVVHADDIANEELRQSQQIRTNEDDLPIWHAVRRYKLVTVVAMLAAFSASLDGYRKDFAVCGIRYADVLSRNLTQCWHRIK